MIALSLPSSFSPAQRRDRAFTLVEIMVVVVLIGLLCALALPAFQRVQERSKISRMANDLRVFSQTFETYMTQQGSWPADVAPGVIPPELAGQLPTTFTKATPFGGQYEWDNEPGLKSVTLYNLAATVAVITKLDALIDDGNPATGHFQYDGSEWHLLLQ